MEVHRNYFSQYIAALSSNIATLLPGDLNYCFFPNSGSESVDWSLKTAFKYHDGKRQNILYSDIAFHGKLLDQKVLQTRQKISLIILEYQELFSLDLMILSLLKSKLIR